MMSSQTGSHPAKQHFEQLQDYLADSHMICAFPTQTNPTPPHNKKEKKKREMDNRKHNEQFTI